jgi:hypothetical protein
LLAPTCFADSQVCHIGQYGGETCFGTYGRCEMQVRSLGGACVYKSTTESQSGSNRNRGVDTQGILDSYNDAFDRQQERNTNELKQQLLREQIQSERTRRAGATQPGPRRDKAKSCAEASKFLLDQGMVEEAKNLLSKCIGDN